ncbi:MAG TPA: phage holin family protein, partial [Acidimicrobiia bacterium]|nr:phage holin family protein [Acidimicrobiia bacterium]
PTDQGGVRVKWLLSLLVTGAALWVAVSIVPGFEFSGTIWVFIGLTIVLWAVNAVVKPIITLLSLPIVVLTLGLFLLVVNAIALQIVVWLAAPERLDLGLTSTGFFWATFLGALTISLVSLILDKALKT